MGRSKIFWNYANMTTEEKSEDELIDQATSKIAETLVLQIDQNAKETKKNNNPDKRGQDRKSRNRMAKK